MLHVVVEHHQWLNMIDCPCCGLQPTSLELAALESMARSQKNAATFSGCEPASAQASAGLFNERGLCARLQFMNYATAKFDFYNVLGC